MPERPDSMDRDDVVGAKAAAQYFIEMYPYVYATGDLEEWVAMAHEDCQFCANVVANVTAIHADGGYGVGGDIVVEDVRAMEPGAETEYFRVGLQVTEAPSVVYTEIGSVQSSTSGGGGYYLTALSRESGRWVVRAVSAETASP
ncbi:DUF6318 family protein [Georgenia faecalis]|uniref:DUF6318 family protein n=1 Tax=Georgenia faecalis TaxID=2483799 RepID=UPI000FD8388E